MLSLPNILKLNAISSGATGLLLVLFSGFFASLFGVDQVSSFIGVGIFLILFAGFVGWAAIQKPINKGQITFIIWLDRLWVVGSFIAIALLASHISLTGTILITGVAIWVATMAVLQSKGLRMTGSY
jgi:type II secretory pathway component PulF